MKCILCREEGGFDFICSHDIWKLYKCKKCNFLFWYPLIFDKEQYKGVSYITHSLTDIVTPYHIKAIGILNDYLIFNHDEFNVLDIGCGNGSFLKLLKNTFKYEVSCYGIDLNCNAIDYAKKIFGDNVTCCNFLEKNDLTEAGRLYDIICFFEVLEHQTDLYGFIEKVKKLLKPNGYIIGTVPQNSRYIPLGKRSSDDYPPHHFTWWESGNLENFFIKNRFDIIQIVDCNYWTLYSLSNYIETIFLGGFKKILKEKFFFKKNKHVKNEVYYLKSSMYTFLNNNRILKILRSVLFMPISFPLYIKYILKGKTGRQLLFFCKKSSD